MTVSAQTPINRSIGNGVTTVFPYDFKILAESDILVTVDGVAKTLNVDYTVSGVGNESGGNVTMTVAPANLTSVVRRRNMALVRTTDYQDLGELPAATLDADIDAAVLMIQQVDEQIGRALTLTAGVAGVSAELPEPVAFTLLGWNDDGTAIENYPPLSAGGSDAALVTYEPAGAGAVAMSVRTKLRESVSVKDFGAVGDGVTDDSSAIQAAIDSLPATGGTVFFPSGTYLVNAGITIKTRVTLVGAGRNSTIIKAGTAGITVLGLSGTAYNMRIRRLSVDGNNLAAKGIAILGASNGSNAHHVIEDVLVSGCTTNNIHLKFIIYGRFVNVYSAQGSSTAPTVSVLLEDMLNSEYEQCVFYNGTSSTLHLLRSSENYFHKTTVYNDVAYPATQLVLIDSGQGNKFEVCTFEPQGASNVTYTVSLQDTTTGNAADHSFIGCRFIGLANTKTHDINIGVSGAVYKTLIRDCQFIKPTATESIKLTSQAYTEISGCIDLTTYDTPTYAAATILNSSGNPYYIYNRLVSTATQPTVYTEGTWTPALVPQTSGSITLTAPTNSMSYTRIGNRVLFSGRVTVASVSAPVGDLWLTGLPFTVNNSVAGRSGVSIHGSALLNTSAHTAMQAYCLANTTAIVVRGYSAGADVSTFANNIQAGTVLIISGSYQI